MPGLDDFWITQSLEELATAQVAKVVESIEVLQDNTTSDEEAEAVLSALGL